MAPVKCPTCGTEVSEGEPYCPSCGAPVEDRSTDRLWNPDTLVGTMVGEYKIMGFMEEGGMGVVYRAEHPIIGKKAVVKILKEGASSGEDSFKRFVSEARAVNKIHHPNIVDVFSFGRLPDGAPYMIMEYLQGETLQSYINRHPVVTWQFARHVLAQIFDALEAAHAEGIVHRDLKPDNIFLVKRGDDVWVKLLDFGIAKFLGSESMVMTSTGVPMGTPHYMSPEQCDGAKNVDPRSDIYSLGILMYRMFTGAFPFHSQSSAMAIMNAHLFREPPPPSMIASVPADLEEVILWCLRKKPDERPQSICELRERVMPILDRLSGEGGSAEVHGDPEITSVSIEDFEHMTRRTFRKWLVYPLVGTVVLFLLVLTYLVAKTRGARDLVVVERGPSVMGTDGNVDRDADAGGKRSGGGAVTIENNSRILQESTMGSTMDAPQTADSGSKKPDVRRVQLKVEPADVKSDITVRGGYMEGNTVILKDASALITVNAPGYETATVRVDGTSDAVSIRLRRRVTSMNTKTRIRRSHGSGSRYSTRHARPKKQTAMGQKTKPAMTSPMVDDYL